MGFRLVTSARCGGGFFAGFASGFRWCLAVLSRSPGGCCFGRVWARLRCVLCPRAGEGFLLGLRPDLGGVWLFWVDRREVAVLGVSGLGCVAFCVHVLGPVSSPLGVSDLSLRHAAGEGFLLGLRPDLGGVWLFWVDRREVAVLGVSGLGCAWTQNATQPSPDTPKTATSRRSTQNSQTPPKSGRKPSKKPSPARGHKTQRNLAQTRPKQQPPGDRLKTAKHHLNPDANPAKNPPPQRGEVTSLKPLKEKKQAPARGHKTQRNLGQEAVKHHCFSTNIHMQTYVSPTPFFSPPPRKRRGVGGYIYIYIHIYRPPGDSPLTSRRHDEKDAKDHL